MLATTHLVVWIFSFAILVYSSGIVSGQTFPDKPIRFVTSGLGGGNDFTARVIAQGISGSLGQQVVVENRPAGVIQVEAVYKAPPDGYTLLVSGGTFFILPLLQKTSYDVVRDFLAVTLTDASPNILVVHPSVPAKSVKELIALAKANPGKLNFGSIGAGGSNHLAAELFKSMAGINIVHIPYKATGLAVNDLIAGETQMQFGSGSYFMPHVKTGRLRVLGVASAKPSALFPELPTVASSGLPGYEAVGLAGVFAPAKTPAAIINRLNQEIVRFLDTADAKQKFLNSGGEVIPNSPEQSNAIVKAEIAKWGKVIKDAGIKID